MLPDMTCFIVKDYNVLPERELRRRGNLTSKRRTGDAVKLTEHHVLQSFYGDPKGPKGHQWGRITRTLPKAPKVLEA